MNILWDADATALERYRFALGGDTQALDSAAVVARALHENAGIQQVIIGPEVSLDQACELAEAARLDRPELGVILLRHRVDVTALSQALRSGVREVVVADDHSALVEALRRSADLTARLIGHAGGARGHGGQGRHGLLGQGRRGQDDAVDQPRHLPRQHRRQDPAARPRPRLR